MLAASDAAAAAVHHPALSTPVWPFPATVRILSKGPLIKGFCLIAPARLIKR